MATVAVVTGAGRGIGRACLDSLDASVDRIVALDRDGTSLSSLEEEWSGRSGLTTFEADITDQVRLDDLARLVAELGTLRSVAHAAGIATSMGDWRAVFSVDLVGSALLLGALRPLVVRGTAAVLFASIAAELVVPNGAPEVDAIVDDPLHPQVLHRLAAHLGGPVVDPTIAYAWAKRGVQRLARREAASWGAVGGRVLSVSPGIIDTPMGRQEAAAQPSMAGLVELTPLHREGRAHEVASVVAFLLSDDASFVTGTDLRVDGGLCAAVASTAGRMR